MLSDIEIVEKLRQGRTHFLDQCYSQAFPKVKRMITSKSGTDDDAKDIFQESIVVFYQNCLNPSFVLSSSISTYLYAISWRLWMKSLRDNGHFHMEITESTSIIEEFDFELESKNSDIMENVLSVMQTLGKNCKEILMQFYFKKLSFDAIAVNLDYKDERAVREQKYRCMKRIKEEMKEYVG